MRRGFGKTEPDGQPGAPGKGLCPVCRKLFRLRRYDGKIGPHGKTAAAPRGCAGYGQPPLRERITQMQPGVRPIRRPGVPFDVAPLPDLGIQVLVEPRDPPPVPAHLRPRPDGPGAA